MAARLARFLMGGLLLWRGTPEKSRTVSLFVDIDTRKVVFVTEGRDAKTIERFADHVDAHNSDASRIKEVCIDMSGAFISGVTDNLTEAEITFDKFVHAKHGSAMMS